MMGVVWAFLVGMVVILFVQKYWCFWCKSKVCLVGKTAIVTGGASGLGFQTALGLASKGCRIIVADICNISGSVEELQTISKNTNIIGKKIDLQSFQSVRAFAEDIIKTEPRLDILVCNGGIGDYRVKCATEDGLERTMQINYFSHFLLTHLLLDLLKKSAPSRVTFTSSMTAYCSDLSMETLNPKSDYYKSMFHKLNGGVYSNSKLAKAAAAKMFGERLKGTGVIVNACHPGIVKTPIFAKAITNDKNVFGLLFMPVIFLWGKTPEEGAQTLIHIAHSDEVKNVTGQSFVEGMRVPRPFILTDQFCDRLWKESIRLTKLEPQEVAC